MSSSALALAETKARGQQRRNSRLLKETARRAAELEREREKHRRAELRHRLKARLQTAQRVQSALEGVNAICHIGRSKQFQALIKARGRSVILFGGQSGFKTPGFDMADIAWNYVGYIAMTPSALEVHCYTETSSNYGAKKSRDSVDPPHSCLLRFPYGVDDEFLHSRQLWKIAQERALDLESVPDDEYSLYETAVLFEVLVECANARNLGSWFRYAIR